MTAARDVVGGLADRGVTAVSGVPCSFLTPVINQMIGDPRLRYQAATQEGEAVAIAAGAWLGGGLGCVIGQNSGLGNMVNPLTSLLATARIPALMMITWRGEPGRPDEPQHDLMGRITTGLLDLMEVPWALLPADPAALDPVLDTAWEQMIPARRPAALVIRKDTVAPAALHEPAWPEVTPTVVRSAGPVRRPARSEVLGALLTGLPPEAALVTTTGYTSRELYALDDRPSNFYLVGAMGSAAAVGLGVASHTRRPVVVVDGDGALLMRLGGLATVGRYGRGGLVHLVLDNGQHESTGGQATVTSGVDVAGLAGAAGYHRAYACSSLEEMTAVLPAALAADGPVLIHLPIRAGTLPRLPRPRVGPAEVAQRFREFVVRPVEPVPAGEAR